MKKIILLLTISIFIISCSKDDNITTKLNFSTSPIDLKGIDAYFAKDIAYGSKDLTKLDVFMPKSSKPTSMVIYIHGGGFLDGEKEYIYKAQKEGLWDFPKDIRVLLKNNIAVATINYSLLIANEKEGVIKSLNDSKRALQYIRSRAGDFNIDKNKIVLAGNSAGAGTSLWLAFSDDLKDDSSSDKVLRESTRVLGVAVRNTQATYDLERWASDVFADYGISFDVLVATNKDRIAQFYGISDFDKEYNTDVIKSYRKSVDMLELMTSDDPEFWTDNTLTDVVPPLTTDILNHHAFHARELKERADKVGITNIAYYGKNPIIQSDASGESWTDFAIRKLKL